MIKTNIIISIRNYCRALFLWLVVPNTSDEDSLRVGSILNVILLASIVLVSAAFFAVVHATLVYGDLYKGSSPVFIASIMFVFLGLFIMSHRGYTRNASIILLLMYFLVISSGVYYYGADQTQTLLSYAVIIVMSGVLLGTRYILLATLSTILLISIFGMLQIKGVHSVYSQWKQEGVDLTDIIIFSITFAVLAVISWLSTREIKKSLTRARGAEKDLRAERDSLEIKVKERTAELERVQFEKTKQMQNFVEFGRNASGLFHDMVNPVQAAILAVYNLKKNVSTSDKASLISSVDDVAIQMEMARKFIDTARSQIIRQDINISFDPEEQIAFVFQMLSFKAKREKVKLVYSLNDRQSMLAGNPLSFHRLLAGLISNAIDSYDGIILNDENTRTVTVTNKNRDGYVYFSVIDNGEGINEENQKKIFELFFTTKSLENGTGLGLVLCKEIAEKEFGGELSFKSEDGKGSTFTIKLPLKKPVSK